LRLVHPEFATTPRLAGTTCVATPLVSRPHWS